jgi:hypothetical protein
MVPPVPALVLLRHRNQRQVLNKKISKTTPCKGVDGGGMTQFALYETI